MRRTALQHVALARSGACPRRRGIAWYSSQHPPSDPDSHPNPHPLERFHNLKPSHELPGTGRARVWKEEASWPMRLAFRALGLAIVGALAYEANRYFNLNPAAKRILDKNQFLPFTLIAKEAVSSDCSIFTLVPARNKNSVGDPYERLWSSPVWSVQAKQPQLQVARSYTPLPPSQPYVPSDPNACALRFMIREETNGTMSGYLHRLGVGAVVELRGPTIECQIPKELDEIVFFAGGTGIAPALQVAHHLSTLAPGTGKTPRLRIVWSSRRREDCAGGVNGTDQQAVSASGGLLNMWGMFSKATQPAVDDQQLSPESSPSSSLIVRELERLKAQYTGRLEVDYYVDEEKVFVDAAAIRRYVMDTPTSDPAMTRKAIMVSGPDGFVKYLAGAKVWSNGQEQQGPLGGLLQHAVPPQWTVIKL